METTVKISIYNGDTKLRNAYKTTEFNEVEAKDFIFNTLSKVVEQQNKLKLLGAKSNFFGLSEFKENFIDIDITQGDEVKTIASGITFKFSSLKNVENKREAFNIIFDTQSYLLQSHTVIE